MRWCPGEPIRPEDFVSKAHSSEAPLSEERNKANMDNLMKC